MSAETHAQDMEGVELKAGRAGGRPRMPPADDVAASNGHPLAGAGPFGVARPIGTEWVDVCGRIPA